MEVIEISGLRSVTRSMTRKEEIQSGTWECLTRTWLWLRFGNGWWGKVKSGIWLLFGSQGCFTFGIRIYMYSSGGLVKKLGLWNWWSLRWEVRVLGAKFLTSGVGLVRAGFLGWQIGGSVEWMMLAHKWGASCEGNGKWLYHLDHGRFGVGVIWRENWHEGDQTVRRTRWWVGKDGWAQLGWQRWPIQFEPILCWVEHILGWSLNRHSLGIWLTFCKKEDPSLGWVAEVSGRFGGLSRWGELECSASDQGWWVLSFRS